LGKLLHPRNGPRVRLFQGRQVTAPLRHHGQSCPGATLAMRLRPDRPDRGDRIRTTARGLLVQGRGFLAGEATSTRTPMGTAMSGRHPGDMDEPLWTAKEVAEFLNVSRDSLGHDQARAHPLHPSRQRATALPPGRHPQLGRDAGAAATARRPRRSLADRAHLMRVLQERAARGGQTRGAEGNGVSPGPPQTRPDLAQSCSSAAHRLS
jgi:hypothetical protein